jgi:hypothetical protein
MLIEPAPHILQPETVTLRDSVGLLKKGSRIFRAGCGFEADPKRWSADRTRAIICRPQRLSVRPLWASKDNEQTNLPSVPPSCSRRPIQIAAGPKRSTSLFLITRQNPRSLFRGEVLHMWLPASTAQ